ncbi:hypothetical protein HY641_00275 [Candidatus Woesearchaeota archaeon]|nr:hypothetical protein [Candidatus Woesearchaeota archaeon]
MKPQTVTGVFAILAMLGMLLFGSSITGAAVSEVGRCRHVLNPSGVISTECEYEGPVAPMFRLRPGAILFVPSGVQQWDDFGSGSTYDRRVFRQAVRDRMGFAGGTRIGVISQSGENLVFENPERIRKNMQREAAAQDRSPVVY